MTLEGGEEERGPDQGPGDHREASVMYSKCDGKRQEPRVCQVLEISQAVVGGLTKRGARVVDDEWRGCGTSSDERWQQGRWRGAG